MIDRTIPIHDRNDPRVAAYADQKDAWLRAAHHPDRTGPDGASDTPACDGLFMAEGTLVVEHLFASGYPVESVLVSEHRIDALTDLLSRAPAGVPVYAAPRRVLESIVGFDVHRGLLACGRRLPARDPMDLARTCRALVVLEDLSNHDNIGSVFRSAAVLAGAGVGVLLSPRCCDPLYRKALRVSMGHALRIPFAVLDHWPHALSALADLGFDLITLDSRPGAEPIDQTAPPPRPALIFGAEGPGLSPGVRARGVRAVTISQAPGVDSLNIAVAAAVALHRLVRPSGAGADGP